MEKPRCPKCKGFLKLDYSFIEGRTKEMISCINCGWYGFLPAATEAAKQEEPILEIAPELKQAPAVIQSARETTMPFHGDCKTCGRTNIHLQSTEKCARCYDRIKKGKDPVTGEPATAQPAAAPAPQTSQQAAATSPTLLDDVTWAMIKMGYKGVAISRAFKQATFPPDVTVEQAIDIVAGMLGKDAATPAPVSANMTPVILAKKESSSPLDPYQLAITFNQDVELHDILVAASRYNRRSLADEILFRLDRSLDGRRALAAFQLHVQGAQP